jgi:hypothetical protein
LKYGIHVLRARSTIWYQEEEEEEQAEQTHVEGEGVEAANGEEVAPEDEEELIFGEEEEVVKITGGIEEIESSHRMYNEITNSVVICYENSFQN